MNTPGSWADIGFEVEFTEDGSPSLRQLESAVEPGAKGESMHHSGGAAAETELIYGLPIAQAFASCGPLNPASVLRFASVGLGLGYVELVIARESLRHSETAFELESWETVAPLRECFLAWIFGRPLPEKIRAVYETVGEFVVKGSAIRMVDLKACLARHYDQNAWVLHAGLSESTYPERPVHGLLFDAFSAKTNPDLWTQDFLVHFFSKALADDCFVSTYASRTTLKNALRETGFEIRIREGFKGKRNSTLAYKGVFKAIFAPAGIS